MTPGWPEALAEAQDGLGLSALLGWEPACSRFPQSCFLTVPSVTSEDLGQPLHIPAPPSPEMLHSSATMCWWPRVGHAGSFSSQDTHGRPLVIKAGVVNLGGTLRRERGREAEGEGAIEFWGSGTHQHHAPHLPFFPAGLAPSHEGQGAGDLRYLHSPGGLHFHGPAADQQGPAGHDRLCHPVQPQQVSSLRPACLEPMLVPAGGAQGCQGPGASFLMRMGVPHNHKSGQSSLKR